MALFLHLWIFSHSNKRKQFNNFIKTANKLFWLDLEHFTRRFQPVYEFLFEILLSTSDQWASEQIPRVLLDIFALVSKFFFYYNKESDSDTLQQFLSQTQTSLLEFRDKLEFPKGHQKLQTLNMFVNEVVRHIKLLRNEDLIIMYLEKCVLFSGPLTIPGTKTKINLQTVLLDYSTPGSPYFPTRKIRQQAKKTIDIVFPGGRRTRLATNWVFRFFSPFELLKSWWFWIVSWILGFYLFLLGLLNKNTQTPHDVHIPQEHKVNNTTLKENTTFKEKCM